MVFGLDATDDRRMTTEQPTAPRALRRRGDERVLGGVASGIADYFNIDPLLVRIAFVGLMVFNGLGLLLYLVAWVFIPTDTDNQSVIQRVLDGRGIGGAVLAGGLILILAIVFLNVPPSTYVNPGGIELSSGGLQIGLVALIAIVIGILLFRRHEPATDVAAASAATEAAARPAPRVERVVVRRRPRPRSPLGWYVLGAVLVGIGLLAIVTGVTGTALDPGRYFGLALAVVGIGLVIGAWWGRARLLILLGLLLLPFAFAASLISVPFEGGFGSHHAAPTTAAELRDTYRLAGGSLVLDLTQMTDRAEPIEITATVAMGEVTVWLPPEAGVEVDAAVGGGSIWMIDRFEEGTSLTERRVVDGDGPQFVMDLEAGLGSVRVEFVDWENR
jgi:phage shock protein PspC (stress-responsive transcriptional regulator)